MTWRAALVLALSSLGAVGCDEDLTENYQFVVRVQSDPGRGLGQVKASGKGVVAAQSDANGVIALSATGREGEMIAIAIECPAGHRPPPEPIMVPLRRLSGNVKPEFSATCEPMTRSVVVAVRAENGPHLPVRFLGRELARTDDSGAAHMLLDIPPGEVLEITLDTSERPFLRPKSPTVRLAPSAREEITLVNQAFSLAHQPSHARAPVRRGPVRIE